MTWGLVIGLAIGAYAFKVLGLVVIGDRTMPEAWHAVWSIESTSPAHARPDAVPIR